MYTKEDVISQRICITGIPNRDELENLQLHFLGKTIKEGFHEYQINDISVLFYRFYKKLEVPKDESYGSMFSDYSNADVPREIRSSKTINYNEFLYQKYFTKKDVLEKKLYIRNIPSTKDLLYLTLHINPRANIPFIILAKNVALPKNNVYRFFDIREPNKAGFLEIKEDDNSIPFGYERSIDFSQFTYGDKYTREYVQQNRVLIHSIPTKEDFKKLKDHMFENSSEKLRSLLGEELVYFNTNDAYRFFPIKSEDIIRCAMGHIEWKYPTSLIDKYNISTYIPYSAFNYGLTKSCKKEKVVKIIKEMPKLSSKWNVVFNDNHCIVNNIKWDNNLMKTMSDLLIRDMFEEMPKFEDDLIKILEYYELYELKK